MPVRVRRHDLKAYFYQAGHFTWHKSDHKRAERPSPLNNALAGKSGTTFMPRPSNLKARQKWLASGSITLGSITVDKGAAKALQQRRSLLTVGINKVQGRLPPEK